MKTDERHKLRTNQFSVFLDEFPKKVRRHARLLLTLLAVVLLAVVLVWYLRHRRSAYREQAWNELAAVTSELNRALADRKLGALSAVADRFAQVAAAYPDQPPVTTRSYYYQGHVMLLQASEQGMAGSRAGYLALLSKAEQAFEQALTEPYDPLASPAARVGLATIAMDRSRFERARELYGEVINDPGAAAAIKAVAIAGRGGIGEQARPVVFVRAPRTPTTSAEVPIPPLPEFPGAPDWAEGLNRPLLPPSSTPSPELPDVGNSGEPGRPATPTTQPQ